MMFSFLLLLFSYQVFLFKHPWHFSDLGPLLSSCIICFIMNILSFFKFSQASCIAFINFIFYAKHRVSSIIYLHLSSNSPFLFSFHCQLSKGGHYLSITNLHLPKERNHQFLFHFRYEPIACWLQHR